MIAPGVPEIQPYCPTFLPQEKLNKVQYAEEQARVEKERSELDVMKLERELEKLQYQVGLSLNQLDFKVQLPRWN